MPPNLKPFGVEQFTVFDFSFCLMSKQLLDEGAGFLARYPPEIALAKKCFDKALIDFPNEITVLDASGAFYAEYEDESRAVSILMKSIEIQPNGDPRTYFYLGQLSQGEQALMFFKKGVQLATSIDVKNAKLSALCSIGELYMTPPLCDAPEAEEASENAFRQALAIESNNFEALVGLAGFLKVVGDLDEAKQCCLTALKRSDQDMIDEDENECDLTDEPFPVRLNLARTLIDLEMASDALDVLHGLLDEDEEDIEVWYVAACAHMLLKDTDSAKETIKHAKDLCRRSRQDKELWGASLDFLEKQIP